MLLSESGVGDIPPVSFCDVMLVACGDEVPRNDADEGVLCRRLRVMQRVLTQFVSPVVDDVPTRGDTESLLDVEG